MIKATYKGIKLGLQFQMVRANDGREEVWFQEQPKSSHFDP